MLKNIGKRERERERDAGIWSLLIVSPDVHDMRCIMSIVIIKKITSMAVVDNLLPQGTLWTSDQISLT